MLLDIAFERGRFEVEARGQICGFRAATKTRRQIVDGRKKLVDKRFRQWLAVVDQYELPSQFRFVAADQSRHENLELQVHLSKRAETLLSVDHETRRDFSHIEREPGA